MKIPTENKKNILDALLPRPQTLVLKQSDMYLDSKARIFIAKNTDGKAEFAAQRLSELIEEEFAISLPVEINESLPKYTMIVSRNNDYLGEHIVSVEKMDFDEEEYSIDISNGSAVFQASTSRGLLWAAMTFRQLLVEENGMLLACGVSIQDKPHYSFRGFMIDAARAPISLAQMKRIIRICSVFKMNHVIFREGDDEFNAVRYRTNKLGVENPYAISLVEAEELIEYGEKYGISIVPEIESLGHSAAKANCYPHLIEGGYEQNYGELFSHRRKAYLKPCDKESYALLESIYEEWLPVMKSSYMHLGIDEVPIDEQLREKHLEKLIVVLEKVAKGHGRKIIPIIWSDATKVHDDEILPLVRCIWGYEEHGKVSFDNPHLIEQGIDILFKDGCEQPVLMAGGSGSRHAPYSKGTYEDAFDNLLSWARLGRNSNNCLGLIAVQWAGNMLDEWLPDFLAAADWGWNPPESFIDIPDYIQRTITHLSRLIDFSQPGDHEKEPPAWYGIWLKEKELFQDILIEIKGDEKTRKNLKLY